MKVGIVISSGEPETVWNAVRFGNFSLGKGDTVAIFLIGKGVDLSGNETFHVEQQISDFSAHGGRLLACGTCLKTRGKSQFEYCPMSTLEDLYAMTRDCDRLLTF